MRTKILREEKVSQSLLNEVKFPTYTRGAR